ncbi:unnamed protein product [Lupinus luteus]|uniref:Uncharacterized protein n=1 Tax=Lupinus luteus TaxID=3873 RepID=A0AAV1XHT9_LUPLU
MRFRVHGYFPKHTTKMLAWNTSLWDLMMSKNEQMGLLVPFLTPNTWSPQLVDRRRQEPLLPHEYAMMNE